MIPAGVRIFICTEPVDMRRGFDRLAQTAREQVGHDPQRGGALFVFANRRATRLKVLWFERNGYCMLYKRLHGALFHLPVKSTEDATSIRIDGDALARLLEGVARPDRESSREKLDAKAAV